jgi:hypothetical protein
MAAAYKADLDKKNVVPPVLPMLKLYCLLEFVLLSQAGHVTLEGALSYISPSANSMTATIKANLDRKC